MKKNHLGGVLRFITERTYNWKFIISGGVNLVLLAGLYLYKLASLPGGYSINEQTYANQNLNLDNMHWAIGLPHLLVTKLFALITTPELSARLASVTFMLLAIVLFFVLIKKWHNTRIAIFSSIIFATSALLLHAGRYGGYMIVAAPLLLASLLLAVRIKYQPADTKSPWLLFLTVFLIAVSFYIPGMLWFAGLFIVFGFKELKRFITAHSVLVKCIAGVIGLLVLLPLVLYIAHTPSLALQQVTGITVSGNVLDKIAGLWHIPQYLFIGGFEKPELWLGGLAIVDAFVLAMLLLGTYFYVKRRKELSRTKIIAAGIVLAYLLAAMGNFAMGIVLFVLLLIVVSAGIDELLKRWLTVFPYNPIARSVGIGFLAILVTLAVFYNIRHYFVAWADAPETKQVYVIKSDTIVQN